MKFLYLRLTNFLSYKDLELNLTDIAYTAVTGQNGAGKSTIPAAIPWILYGTLRVNGDRDSVVNDESDSAEGYLDIQDNEGNLWQVARGRDYGGNGWIRLFEWNKEQEDWVQFGDHLNNTAQLQINKIVGLTEDAYYSLILIDQSATAGGSRFTTADSNTRRAILHGLVPELALWADYHANAGNKLTDSKRELGKLDQTIENSKAFIIEQESQKSNVLELVGDESQESIDSDLLLIDKKMVKLTKKIALSSGINEDEIEARIEAAKSKHQLNLSNIRKDLDGFKGELDNLDVAEKELLRLKNLAVVSDEEYDRVKEERKTLKRAIKGLEAEAEELVSKSERLEPKLEALETATNKGRARLTDIREQIDGLKNAIEKDNGECPVCASPLSTKKCHSLVDTLEAERVTITIKLDDDTASFASVKKKLLDSRTLSNTTNGQIQRNESRIESLAEKLDALDKIIDESTNYIETTEKMLGKMRTEEKVKHDIEVTKVLINSAKSDYDNNILSILEKELETAQAENRNEQLEDELINLKDKQNKFTARSQQFSRHQGSISILEDSIDKLQDALRKDVARQTELNEEITELTWLDRALSQKGIPSMLLDSVLGAIEHEQNLILEQLSDSDQMQVEFRQSKELKSREGTKDVLDIVVHTLGGRERLIESFSFGERVRLSISNVFAMIKVFNERSGGIVKTLFLDEPLGPLDERSIPAFIEVLRVAMNTGIVDSIWVITHDRTVIDALPQQVRVSLNESRHSIVTVN